MSNNDTQTVRFTQKQVDYLNKQFPEVSTNANTTNDALRHMAGQRSVVRFISERIQKDNR